ncbi:hypothetical protein F5H01DRAFT_342969 [Linnemannia elongata]|nr:hypothetical protein F5H01DRAFT_342969 [Linnemannia elongata]
MNLDSLVFCFFFFQYCLSGIKYAAHGWCFQYTFFASPSVCLPLVQPWQFTFFFTCHKCTRYFYLLCNNSVGWENA